jgi:hypothetical protein
MKKILLLAIGVFLSAQLTAYADWINASVVKVDSKENMVTFKNLEAQNADKDMPSLLDVKVKKDANLKNLASLNDLKPGNTVKVNVQKDQNLGIWEASGIELNQNY